MEKSANDKCLSKAGERKIFRICEMGESAPNANANDNVERILQKFGP
jgi:hypothetical protein